MLPIIKHREPEVLVAYKRRMSEMGERATYEGFTGEGKEPGDHGDRIPESETPFFRLRTQLLQEQYYLCAYCGQEVQGVVGPSGMPLMKTEHFIPKNDSSTDLDYTNLLGCCRGNDRSKGDNHCDSAKGDRVLEHIANPAQIVVRDADIRYGVADYSEEVIVLSEHEGKHRELTGRKYLNLNHSSLKMGRYSAYRDMLRRLGDDPATWDRPQVAALRAAYADPQDGRHLPFVDFLLWWLDEWLGANT